jgi:O-antigen ligase
MGNKLNRNGLPFQGQMKNSDKYDGILKIGFNIYTWLLFFCIPFLGGNHLALPYITIDRFWIETTFLLLLTTLLLITFLKGTKTASGIRTFLVFLGPFLIISIISLCYTWNFYNSLKEINVLVWVVGTIYVYSLNSDKELPLRALVWGSVFTVICAILQAKVLYPQLSIMFTEGNYARMLAEKPVPFVAFLNENMFGGFLTLIIPIAIYQAFIKKNNVFICSIPLIITGILLSLSRLSFIVMVLEFVSIMGVFLFRRKWGQSMVIVMAAAIGLAIFLLTIHIQGNASEKRLEASISSKTSTALGQVKTLNLRTSTWESGLRAFKEQPILGYGSGAFEYAYRKYFGGRLYTRYSHGSIIKIAVEVGAIGLAAFLWYLFGVGTSILKKRFQPGLITLSIAGGFLFGLVDCAFDTPAFVISFFLISSTFLIREQTILMPRMKIKLLIMTLLILVSFGFTGKAGLAKKSIDEGDVLQELGSVSGAIASYKEASMIMPIDNEGYIRLMTILTRIQLSELDSNNRDLLSRKLAIQRQRMERDRDSELYFISALGDKMLGNDVQALHLIREAIALYPSSPYYLIYAVTWYLEKSELSEALALVRSFDPFVDNIKQWGNPYGLYIYRLRDLEAEIELQKGEIQNAISIAKSNLESAKRNEFVISSYKTREFVSKEQLLQYLSTRLSYYESQEGNFQDEN